MKVILSSVETLLNNMPQTLRELCSQFMFTSMDGLPISKEFDAKIDIHELEEFNFNYLYIKEDEYSLVISTPLSELTVDINELNYSYEEKDWDEHVEDSIIGFGDFIDAATKLQNWYKIRGKDRTSYDLMVHTLKDFINLNVDDYDIICLECAPWIREVLLNE